MFYQISRAYIVGRVIGRSFVMPLVIALKNTDGGVLVDAVILSEDDISIVFSFTRSYFHVDLERVGEAVVFLKSIMPRKPVSELFTVLGRAKQGKTERYRELMHHLDHAADQFEHAAGERGLVMVCFTLPSFDVVFKVIRDRFAYPKTVLRDEVLAKYQMVFIHDRAGRLVDAQEFRRLRFPRARFSAELLDELRRETGATVHEDGADLVFDHMYIERRMTPLNIYLRTAASAADAERAVLEYGQCIRDLAYTNIFPGDLLLKNFGVTRHGRVIFYDYDELCQVTDCTFRDLPQASNPEDEMRGEAWFYVAESDVFPETFINFLSFDDTQRAALLRMHGEILTAGFWRGVQQRLRDGELVGGAALPPAPRTRGQQPVEVARAQRAGRRPGQRRDRAAARLGCRACLGEHAVGEVPVDEILEEANSRTQRAGSGSPGNTRAPTGQARAGPHPPGVSGVPRSRVVTICTDSLAHDQPDPAAAEVGPGGLAEIVREALERAEPAPDALAHGTAGAAAAARVQRLPVDCVTPDLGGTAMQRAPRRIALGDAHEVLERQRLKFCAADQRLHAIEAHALLVHEVEQQCIAGNDRLEIGEVVRNLR